ncbi:7-alpha-hydroxycholest-4-en-3-one 12-alpha-hydroxylase-like [Pogona vitticeps]|uniref:7-alpha-hydroxycholest-4-en-3-one 12-alpha-hydroxylase-like n=1 Tax=Pogona vitticeps TaxID=103695 RepID=A0A6J0VIP1_9SAUR
MNFWETVLCSLLGSLLAIVLGGLYTAGAFRKRRPKEPPLDKGWIPWLGHGLSFRKNPVEFLEGMRKKHGDIFTVLVGGNYINMVADASTYEAIIKESKDKLDFGTFALVIVSNTFDFHPGEIHHKIVQNVSKKYLNGKNLAALNQIMMQKLQTVMLHGRGSRDGPKSWQQDGVFHFSYKTIFQAAVLSLFGTDPGEKAESKDGDIERKLKKCGELFVEFQKFDHFFPQLALGMLDAQSKKEVDRLRNILWDFLSVEKMYQRDDINPWITEQDREMAEAGMTEKIRTQVQLLLLWASQANTGPATFWILLFLLKHPEAMKAVREEVEKALREAGQEVKPGGPFINVALDTIKTPLLDSTIEETLRLKASTFLFRTVMQEMGLTMFDGKEYLLRKGDQILLFPFLSLNMDPEIYPEPQKFKYDRFLNPDGTKKEFYKNGLKLKYYNMPFGAGPSMCPGRFFAVSEMKMFVILMLSYFDMELINQGEEIPPVDVHRFGFGTANPSCDIQFRYRPRF